jgi:tyrosinase
LADAIRQRDDVWHLDQRDEWHPTLLWYATAIAEMQQRPFSDPSSWRYQAAIHDYTPANDPLRQPTDQLPPQTEQDRFWRQCQHNSWFFLAWHRIYLLCFEQTVATTVKALNGPADWSLPYWNYSDPANANARKLPRAFREKLLPNGKPNPLRIEQRRTGLNDGDALASDLPSTFGDQIVNISRCLAESTFAPTSPRGGQPGFGGPKTRFNHSSAAGAPLGAVEASPHGGVHVAVGGGLQQGEAAGWMSSFDTAALDPAFWLHHANIDRLWVVWNSVSTHQDPSDNQWTTAVQFSFHDGSGQATTFTSSQITNTRVAPLLYRYEDESNPLAAPHVAIAGGVEESEVESEGESEPEMVGATDAPIELSGQQATAELAVGEPTGPALVRAAGGTPHRIYINVENVTGRDPHMYAVYVNLPPGANPEDHRELLAGVLPMFGIREASAADQEHGGSGLHYAFEISDIVRTLRERNEWDPARMQVSFVPATSRAGTGPAAPRESLVASTVRVGRVSVYYA